MSGAQKSKVSTPKRLIGGAEGTPKRRVPATSLRLATQQTSTKLNLSDDSSDADDVINMSSVTLDDSIGVPLSNNAFSITDVAANRKLFNVFAEELQTHRQVALCVACEPLPDVRPNSAIGERFAKGSKSRTEQAATEESVSSQEIVEGSRVVGVAVCCGNRDAYYISLCDSSKGYTSSPRSKLCSFIDFVCVFLYFLVKDSDDVPQNDPKITRARKLRILKKILERNDVTIMAYDVKQHYKALLVVCLRCDCVYSSRK